LIGTLVLAVVPALSFTVTVTVEFPGADGEPEIAPVLPDMVSPEGRPDALKV
jgi:hypothetical protein